MKLIKKKGLAEMSAQFFKLLWKIKDKEQKKTEVRYQKF